VCCSVGVFYCMPCVVCVLLQYAYHMTIMMATNFITTSLTTLNTSNDFLLVPPRLLRTTSKVVVKMKCSSHCVSPSCTASLSTGHHQPELQHSHEVKFFTSQLDRNYHAKLETTCTHLYMHLMYVVHCASMNKLNGLH